ncbi:hypothetical protein [uncultured Caulobacter sp.]|uniref:hypothetical protein n=1 Tax=uncultured Caulobacter sp. TaxID=158749 RepID=UPI00262FF07C|nr:hypothetical protein [uncultured Caulobacter sp.]
MTAQVLSFFQRSPRHAPAPADWSQQELAEFYRVESALIRAGIRVGTDRGLSDEREPWFVFYRADDGEVVIHFARIDGEYVIAGPAYEEIARGFDFSGLVRNMVARHPLIRRADNGGNISVHPAALLVAVVGTAFFKTGEARAAETGASNNHSGHGRPALLASSSSAGLTNLAAPMAAPLPASETVQLPVSQAVLIMAAAMFASNYAVDTASVSAASQTAIAAAAAALDFGTIGAPSAPSDTAVFAPAATHATVVDNTPAQTVSTVLSLVAVLASLPPPSETPAAVAGPLGVSDHADRQDSALAALQAHTDAATWTIDVRIGLKLGGLPSLEAVQLVRGLLGESGAQNITVIEVSKLPDVLADLIARGDHMTVGTPPTLSPAPTTSEPVVTPPAPHDAIVSPPVTTPVTPEAATDAHATPETPADPVVKPPVVDASPAPSPFASPDLVKQFVEYFVSHTRGVEVMVRGADIVMFDASILRDASAATHLTSMHFAFADGGSISLVGNQSSFLKDGILV